MHHAIRSFSAILVFNVLMIPAAADVISGTVLDAETNAPLKAVKVTADAGQSAMTGADGKFTLSSTPSGIVMPKSFADRRKAADLFGAGDAGGQGIRILNAKGASMTAMTGAARGIYFAFIPGDKSSVPGDIGSAQLAGRTDLAKAAVSQAVSLTFLKSGYKTATQSVDGSQADLTVKLATAPTDTTMGYHPFFYAGEWQRQAVDDQKMYIVRDGKIAWTFSTLSQKWNGEYGDATLLSNGNIVFSRQQGAAEIDKDGKVVWNYNAPAGTEIHTCQALGLQHVGVMQNGVPAKWILFNTVTGAQEKTMILPTKITSTHGQFRRVRLTEKGTLLVAHMDMNKISEYDTSTGKEIWTQPTGGGAWAAVRLKNGNTLISGDASHFLREINPGGQTVWEVTQKDVPYKISNVQGAQRLANGNTVFCNWFMNDPKDTWKTGVEVFELTPEKKLVWAMKQYDTLGSASAIQLLDEPGVPESFDLQR